MHLCIFLNLEIKFIGVLLTNGILFKTITWSYYSMCYISGLLLHLKYNETFCTVSCQSTEKTIWFSDRNTHYSNTRYFNTIQ